MPSVAPWADPTAMEKHIRLNRPVVPLVVFDPDALAHRRTEDPGWVRDPTSLEAERRTGSLVTFQPGGAQVTFRVASADAAPGAPPEGERLRVVGTGVYVGALDDVPSRTWGKPRWNLWDWLFAAFLPIVGAFLMWLSTFDRELVWLFAVTTAAFVLMCIPVTWAIFRFGSDFAKRSGVPPKDRPEQVVALPPGEYRIRFARTGAEGVAVDIERVGP